MQRLLAPQAATGDDRLAAPRNGGNGDAAQMPGRSGRTADNLLRLPASQRRAITAILGTPTLKAAAAQCGITSRTVRRWLGQAAFRAGVEAARNEAFVEALARLRAAMGSAVATLEDALHSKDPRVASAAACSLLRFGLQAHTTLDIEKRIAELESCAEDSSGAAGDQAADQTIVIKWPHEIERESKNGGQAPCQPFVVRAT